MSKHIELSINEIDAVYEMAHALASPIRLKILRKLGERAMNVGELSHVLEIPMSTTALAVNVLEDAGLITTEGVPGARGTMKVCSRRLDSVLMEFIPSEQRDENALTLQMPIGGYSAAYDIQPTCGLVDERAAIGEMDSPQAFYLPGRFGARLLWLRSGFLEYRFAMLLDMRLAVPDWLELSFEACSEAPMHRDPWKSDVSVAINGQLLGTWTSPADYGGRRGRLNPSWWSEVSTQYGLLKTWRVDHDGCYLDGERISDVSIEQLAISERDHIAVRIGIDPNAEHVGGLNLFGEHFGDYEQAIVMRVGYHLIQA